MRRSQNFARTHTGRKRGKIFPDKSISSSTSSTKSSSTSSLVMNSYLNDNLEYKQCYFSLGSFWTKRNLNLN